ncbi:uncharacterized protein LOC124486895 [Hypomesus transpacificus]|uniref:uncharacterized protein LOC124486895 n=1 Tax=Hypomesus transpacificus TaxID=137520 RepID=UPI001F076C10|nr:uncharacterized protein LOC124486895 [Hypomesus transpacificus]
MTDRHGRDVGGQSPKREAPELGHAGSCSSSTSLGLDLRVLEDSLLTEKQKLRIVLNWAQNVLRTGPEDEQNPARTRRTARNLENSRSTLSPSEPLPWSVENQAQACSPQSSETPLGPNKLTRPPPPHHAHHTQTTTNDPDSQSKTKTTSRVTSCSKSSDSILVLPSYGLPSRSPDLSHSPAASGVSWVKGGEVHGDSLQTQEKHNVVKEQEEAEHTARFKNIHRERRTSSVRTEDQNPGSESGVTPGPSVYEEYLVCLSRLGRVRPDHNQDVTGRSEKGQNASTGDRRSTTLVGTETRLGDVTAEVSVDCDWRTSPDVVVTATVSVDPGRNTDGDIPADNISTLVNPDRTTASVITTATEPMDPDRSTPADIINMPVDCDRATASDIMTTAKGDSGTVSGGPRRVPVEEEGGEGSGRQGSSQEQVCRTASASNTPEEKTERVLRPRSSSGRPGVRGQTRGRGWRFWEKSSLSWSSFTHGETLPRSYLSTRPLSTGARETRQATPTAQPFPGPRTPPPAPKGTQKISKIKDTPMAAAKTTSPGRSVCALWLCLPDEVWLSILVLLTHCDLSRLAQVCRHLLRLAHDHTLWQHIRVENCSTLTDQWLSCVGGRRPRSLALHRCSGLSVTSSGLELFLSQSKDSLEELRVTGCIGPGFHGDLVLCVIGQCCDHVTSVDVSWSGATEMGVKALAEMSSGLRSVVLNGCQVTDDALTALATRHGQSLSRLEVFGCLAVSACCLVTVAKACPGLQHLNLGQVPKVSHSCLTLMTSRLPHLRTLNLIGLHAVSDVTVDQALQQLPDLCSLTLSSCPGVTDLSLHRISTHTPHIRSLDVSGCREVGDGGVQAVALGCKRLQHLDLSSTAVGSRGVNLLANYSSVHLLTIKLSFCQVSMESILKLCRRCKRLKLLYLYGCVHVPTKRQINNINPTVQLYP